MNAKNVPTLDSLTAAVVKAEAAYKAEANPLVKRTLKLKVNAANAELRTFIYKRKSLGGHCNMVRH